jgi:hypothetical protein
MLKKCVAVACTAVLGGAMIVGFAGCDNKPKTNPPANPPADNKPPEGGAAPTTPPAPGDHDQK